MTSSPDPAAGPDPAAHRGPAGSTGDPTGGAARASSSPRDPDLPADPAPARHYRWAEVGLENLKEGLDRRLIAAERMTLAQVHLAEGCVVPEHAHEHEQLSIVLSGALRFSVGADGSDAVTVRAGEVLHLPSHLPHGVVALEDTIVLDVFSPPRQDWQDGTDDYLRR